MTRLACEGGGGGIGRFAPDPAAPNHTVALVISTEKICKANVEGEIYFLFRKAFDSHLFFD